MKLYASDTSPFVRKVRVMMREYGIAGVTEVAVSSTPVAVDPTITVANPLGKIPALETGEGVLFDSRVICRYLDARFSCGAYPQDRLWQVLTAEAAADGMMEAAVLMVYEWRTRPEEKRHEPWVQGQWDKIARSLAMFEAMPPVLRENPDMGQIALGCALGYLDFRHAARDWRTVHPKLAAWEAEMAARPAMIATIPRA